MANPLYGQITTSNTPARLTSNTQDIAGFTIRAPVANAGPVEIGDSNVSLGAGFVLDPGDSITYERTSQTGQPVYQLKPSDFYVVGNGGKVTWLGSP